MPALAEVKLPVPAVDQSAVVVISAEASYHQLYDNCTVKYLKQAGMRHIEWMPLQSKDIHGNGHMVMIEKNNLAIAKVIDDWVVANVK
jgi:hypothetical protein